MKKKFFGTDGIRGEFNQYPITPIFFFNLANAIIQTNKSIKRVLIGKDTRESSDEIEDAIFIGFEKQNIKCDSCGVVSTPILSNYTRIFDYDLGIMISASHNPYQDNGIKIFKNNGEKLNDKEEIEIEQKISVENNDFLTVKNKTKINSINSRNYEKNLIEKFHMLSNYKEKIFVDFANGSLSKIGPKILEELNLNFDSAFINPDGKNINKNCGATFPKKLSELTIMKKASMGISFDGDADRVMFCDEFGEIVDGDYILALIGIYLKKKGELINNLLVGTHMSNLGFRNFLEKNSIKLLLASVGDRYVIDMMKKNNCILGGEQSGHIIFSENSYCGDGMATALLVMKILHENNLTLAALRKELFVKTPQKLINIQIKNDIEQILNHYKIKNLHKSISQLDNCDILLRKSGTENLLRLMVQADSEELMNEIINKFILEINSLNA